MAINTYLSTIGSKKQNKQTSRTETESYRECFDSWHMGGGLGEGWKSEDIKKCKFVVTE